MGRFDRCRELRRAARLADSLMWRRLRSHRVKRAGRNLTRGRFANWSGDYFHDPRA